MTSPIALLVWAAMSGWLLWVCVGDARERRISNRLVLAGLAMGLIAQALLPRGDGLFDGHHPGSVGLADAGAAVLLAALTGLAIFRAGLFGGGDAKLLAAVAAFTGTAGLLPVLVMTMLSGGVLALATLALTRLRSAPTLNSTVLHRRLPYSWAITAATLVFSVMSGSHLLSG